MKTKEELKAIKEEVETVSRKLNELTEEELERVIGGNTPIDKDTARTHYCYSCDLTESARQACTVTSCKYCRHFGGEYPNYYCKIDKTPNIRW